MTNEGNGGWWGYTIVGAQTANVIFNNNAAPQTADLLAVGGEVWYDNGWVSKPAGFVRQATEVSVVEEATPEVSIYPNPAKNSVFVQLKNYPETEVRVRMFDLSGKEVLTENQTWFGEAMEIQRKGSVSKGLHLVQVQNPATGKLIFSTKVMFE
jgi:hypothetical protein